MLSQSQISTLVEELDERNYQPKTGRYSRKLVLDACLRKLRSPQQSAGMHSIICEANFDKLLGMFYSFIFYDMSRLEHHPLRHIFCKCVPLRCWSRLFYQVTEEEIRNDPTVEHTINAVLLCALLGNYEDLQDGSDYRPRAFVRQALYDMFDVRRSETYNNPSIALFRMRLLADVERVYIHAMQLLLCHFIRSSPVLLDLISAELPFAIFEQRAHAVNQKIRKVFSEHILETDGAIDADVLLEELSACLEGYNTSLLDESYQNPTPPFLEYVSELRDCVHPTADEWFSRLSPEIRKGRQLVVFQEPAYVKPSSVLAAEAKKARKETDGSVAVTEKSFEKEIKVPTISGNSTGALTTTRQINVDVEREIAKLKNGDKDPVPATDETKQIVITKMHITIEHSRALEDIIQRFDPRDNNASDRIIRVLLAVLHEGFGSSPRAVARLKQLWMQYSILGLPKHNWETEFKSLYASFPYTYCLLMATCKLYARHRKVRIYDLPISVTNAQIRAVYHRFGLGGGCPTEPFNMLVCTCCRNIDTPFTLRQSKISKNLVRIAKRKQSRISNSRKRSGGGGTSATTTTTEKKTKREMLKAQMGGSAQMRIHLQSGQCFCTGTTVYAHQRCDLQPLLQISLLGKIMYFSGQAYMICCQSDHADFGFSQFDPLNTIRNKEHFACVVCCRRIFVQQAAKEKKAYPWLHDPKSVKCFLCDTALGPKRAYYLFGKDTYICKGHTHYDILREPHHQQQQQQDDHQQRNNDKNKSSNNNDGRVAIHRNTWTMEDLLDFIAEYIGQKIFEKPGLLKEEEEKKEESKDNDDDGDDDDHDGRRTETADIKYATAYGQRKADPDPLLTKALCKAGRAAMEQAFESAAVAKLIRIATYTYRELSRQSRKHWATIKNNNAHRRFKRSKFAAKYRG